MHNIRTRAIMSKLYAEDSYAHFRGYWRDDEGKWNRLENTQGYPIAYRTRAYAKAAAETERLIYEEGKRLQSHGA